MGTKIIITFLTIVLSIMNSEPEKGNNTIIINDVNQSVIQDFKKILLMNGYEIENEDKEMGFISTKFKPIEGSVHAHNLKVAIKGMINDNQFIIYGNYTFEYNNLNGSMTNASGRAEYHKRKLIGKRLAFDEVVNVSKKINKLLNYASQ